MQQIGIGITTRNRRETAEKTIAEIRKHAPKDSKIVIVDDASDIPYPNANFRFDENVGIAKAKNKCFELLEDCEHIFLFDDDCIPLSEKSFNRYIESPLYHACFTFDRRILKVRKDVFYFEKPCGCMIYLRNEVLQKVGGFDTDFVGYSYEHVNFSDRIFNNNFTPFRYCDVPISKELFQMANVPSSVSNKDRAKGIKANTKLYKERYFSTEFKPYK